MGYKRQGPKYQYWKSLIFRKIPVLMSLRRLLFSKPRIALFTIKLSLSKHRNYPITNGKSKKSTYEQVFDYIEMWCKDTKGYHYFTKYIYQVLWTKRYHEISQVKMSGIPWDISNINEIDLAYHKKISRIKLSAAFDLKTT